MAKAELTNDVVQVALPVFEFSQDGVSSTVGESVQLLSECDEIISKLRYDSTDNSWREEAREDMAEKVVRVKLMAKILDSVAPLSDDTSWESYIENLHKNQKKPRRKAPNTWSM